MPYKFPPVFDASALAEDLVRRPDTKAVGNTILQLLDAASGHTDLLFARELLATIVMDAQGEIEHPSPYSNAVRGALLSQTILLYSRALIVKNARRRFDIRPRLNPAQKKMHDEIDEMRNRAIAHFDRSAARHEVKWADEKVVLPGDDPFRLIPALRRLVVRDELVRSLIDQVQVGLDILDDIRKEKQALAVRSLSDLLDRDEYWAKRLQRYEMDVLALIGDFELIADMLGPAYGAGRIHETTGG